MKIFPVPSPGRSRSTRQKCRSATARPARRTAIHIPAG
jgi:hypothetical protein